MINKLAKLLLVFSFAVISSCLSVNTVFAQSYGTTVDGGLPADPWGSGNSGTSAAPDGPNYIGKSTTWTKSQGQEEIAPEVNIHNMLSMTDHLRRMGYKIPDSVDTAIKTAPAKIRKQIMSSLNRIRDSKKGENPLGYYTGKIMGDMEKSSGLSTDNLLGNSLDIISAK